MAARGTPATAPLAGEGIAYTVHRYQHDPRNRSPVVAVISRAGK